MALRRDERSVSICGMLAAPLRSMNPGCDLDMLHSKRFDQIAIVLSTICIVHCLAVPLLVAFLPVAALAFGIGTHFHELMLWLVAPTSIVGIGMGYRIHRKAGTVLLGAIGLTGIAVAALWGHDAWPAANEAAFSVASSLVLAVAHWRNFRDVRLCHTHN
jgi:hypothetical protein